MADEQEQVTPDQPKKSPIGGRIVAWIALLTALTVGLGALWTVLSKTEPPPVDPPSSEGEKPLPNDGEQDDEGKKEESPVAPPQKEEQTPIVTTTTTTASPTSTAVKPTTTTRPAADSGNGDQENETPPTTRPEEEPSGIRDLGIPAKNSARRVNARNPWDMLVVGDSLYIGGGDYDVNSGPTTIWRYDIPKETWQASATVPTEAIFKLIPMGDTVIAPGIDPTTGSWAVGNYHRLVGTTWETVDNLPNAVHNFDIVTFGGQTFFGIGTSNTKSSPVKVTTDFVTYTDVPFYYNGTAVADCALGDFFRVYDFYTVGNELYCLFLASGDDNFWAFAHYRDGAFEVMSPDTTRGLSYTRFWQDPFGPEVTFDGKCYFTTGILYRTDDFQQIEQVITPDNGQVTDLLTETGGLFQTEQMYILSTVKAADGTYQNTVWLHTGDDDFQEMITFSTELPALSFAKYKSGFFVGLGQQGADSDAVGTILYVK